jgi:hypothetical protein
MAATEGFSVEVQTWPRGAPTSSWHRALGGKTLLPRGAHTDVVTEGVTGRLVAIPRGAAVVEDGQLYGRAVRT